MPQKSQHQTAFHFSILGGKNGSDLEGISETHESCDATCDRGPGTRTASGGRTPSGKFGRLVPESEQNSLMIDRKMETCANMGASA